ncbi:hypothetical protein [Pandoraea apista]|uniref:hypothetical protein n=1 Tax=Pandoraea apista TaxID=93218 RepID=UPI0006583A5B|nr:hypothetical protein [Pandoraea apista]ALS68372.1 hypothetical protein AT395_24815 [Pandoraea apista]ALS68434.1 hypothetical protein AT395_25165 [Pandoraea apista]CFB60462.1 hypothetical protein LMG16407_00501 [Pandoraea apista]
MEFGSEIESMESMVERLGSSGSSEQAKAVVKGIALIRAASGMLDSNNRAVALFHVAVALSGREHAASTLETAAFLANPEL